MRPKPKHAPAHAETGRPLPIPTTLPQQNTVPAFGCGVYFATTIAAPPPSPPPPLPFEAELLLLLLLLWTAAAAGVVVGENGATTFAGMLAPGA